MVSEKLVILQNVKQLQIQHHTISSIKRFMGETFDNVTKEIARVSYKVVKGDNNTPRVEIDDRKYTPQEISAMILQKMKKTAEDYLGTK